MALKPGTLWEMIVERTERSLRSGSLRPIPTEYEFIEDRGMRFFVRMLTALERKDEEKKKQEREIAAGRGVNPFLPYDEDMFIADISDSHVALLNKFNVVEHHLIIVTRAFEDQETILSLKDFEALWTCMAEFNGLGFYNGGEAAGASQKHKHLQMVPLPLAPIGPQVPIEPLLAAAEFENKLGKIPGLPFIHVFVRLDHDLVQSPREAAGITYQRYIEMLRRTGLQSPGTERSQRQSGPYCFLTTREWMLLVPRSRESFDSISINSLGFAGALLVRTRVQLEILKKHGPMNALTSVAVPKG